MTEDHVEAARDELVRRLAEHSAEISAMYVPVCERTQCGTYECSHCHRELCACNGADDDIERAVGPICDDCASVSADILNEIQDRGAP